MAYDPYFSRDGLTRSSDSLGENVVATLWTLRAPTGRILNCSVYQTAAGLELRAVFELASEGVTIGRFHGADADERLAEMADRWRLALLLDGFGDPTLDGS